jgi:hypothetical protein
MTSTIIPFSAVKESSYRYEVGYCRDSRSGNYIVTYCNPDAPANTRDYRQQIVVLPVFFRKITGIDPIVVASVTKLTAEQFDALGFIRKEVAVDARTCIAM